MTKLLPLTALILLPLSPLQAADDDCTCDQDKSSHLTPTAERPPNMANPEKPGWLPQRHGK